MIILKSKSGNIAIMELAPGADKDEAIRKFQECHPEFIEHFEDDIKLPDNRLFRDAWKLNARREIVIDDRKAREIHLGRVRHVRNQELDKLDKEQMRHLADAIKLKELDEKKQALRDLPSKINTLEWPKELPSI